jgi:hypothetical protein
MADKSYVVGAAAGALAAIMAVSCTGATSGDDGDPSVPGDGAHSRTRDGGRGDAEPIGSDEAALYKSGSRIKARVSRTADGAQAFGGWYDSERGADCMFLPAADGRVRCLPSLASGGHFADPSCTQALVYFYSCARAPSEVSVATSPGDGSMCRPAGWHVHSVGTAHEAKVFTRSGERCVESQRQSMFAYHRLGPEIPPSAFVEVVSGLE